MLKASMVCVVIFGFAAAYGGFGRNTAAAQDAPLLVNPADIDIIQGKMEQFLAAIKENAAAAIKEPGCRKFDVMTSKKEPNHVFTFVVFDGPAALEVHRKTDAYKKFRSATKGMIAKNTNGQFSPISMNRKM